MTAGSFCTVGRRSLGDLLAVVEHEHAVAHAHHEFHVVLDQEDRRAVAPNVVEQILERRRFGGVHAGRRFVEREELRARWRARGRSQAAAGRRRRGASRALLRALTRRRRTRAVRARAARSPSPRRAYWRCGISRRTRRHAYARGGRSSRSRARTGWRTAGCSGTCARCRARRRRSACRPVSGWPSNTNAPPSVDIDAGEHVEQLVLPAPLGPISP